MRKPWIFVAAAALSGALLAAAPARAGILLNLFALSEPDGQGDQAIFYYDARDGFTTFLNLRNAESDELDVRILYYSGGFSVPFQQDVTLAAGALRIIDVGGLRESGLASQAGVALAFAVNGGGAPIVTRALTGNFTVANLATQSAWGAPAAARSAVSSVLKTTSGPVAGASGFSPFIVPPTGTVIDGNSVFLQPIQPTALDLATYYDPEDLAPVAQSGNQLIFVSFVDVPGATYSAAPASTPWDLTARRGDGSSIASTTFGASGVNVTDLASVVGPGVNGSAGSIRFTANPVSENVTRMIFFAESLGTFGTGYRLPVPSFPVEPPV